MRVIIVGGGAAGASCAARLRRLNEDVEIIIIETKEKKYLFQLLKNSNLGLILMFF